VAADAVLLGDMAARDSPDRFPGMKRSPPQIGPDVVKIGSTDGSVKKLKTRRAGGHPRSLNAKQGTSR
jgi:hypothetical protein